jgi:hypothetical protein
MAWSSSSIFRAWPAAVLGQGQTAAVLPAGYAGLGADSVKCALFGGNTPDRDAALALTGYNATSSQWVVANEKSSGTDWVAGGRVLSGKTITTPVPGVVMFDAADLTSTATATLSGVEGVLIYDHSITAGTGGIADEGVCFSWFGSSKSVVSGTFSITFNASGIARFTMS